MARRYRNLYSGFRCPSNPIRSTVRLSEPYSHLLNGSDMDRDAFEEAVMSAVLAHPKDGSKWYDLERYFHDEEGLRGSGALDNNTGDTRTRARQLFTTKTHQGFDTDAHSTHAVFVLNQEAATRERQDEYTLPPELEEDELEEHLEDMWLLRTIEKIAAERPAFRPEEGTRSVLIFRRDVDHDPTETEDEVPRPGTEDRDGEETAEGTLNPLVLLQWEDDDVVRFYRDTYDDFSVVVMGGRSRNVVMSTGELSPPSDDPNCELVGVDDAFDLAVSALRSQKHVVLYGPPGTGKTELAEYLCRRLVEEPPDHYQFATATSDWTTFDVIGGYLPDPSTTGGEGESGLDFVPGIITRALESGRWLVLDELNRADIDKAFGELFTLLSDKPVVLAYKKREEGELRDIVLGEAGTTTTAGEEVYEVPVPGHWRMIGTMNTFDKASLYRLSYAFMRRFAFVEVPVPSDPEFRTIIAEATDLHLEDHPDDVRTTVREIVQRVFVDEFGEGGAEDLPRVGPAVAIDVVRYCGGRLSGIPADDREERVREEGSEIVLEGLESLLYPQFEGRNREHSTILESIDRALGLGEERLRISDRRLSTWTGRTN